MTSSATAAKPIPVHIVTGFLGAGKTTFLNHLIRSRPQERILVIENEVGKVNVDSKLVLDAAFDIMELTAGCLCCSLHDELMDVLEALASRRHEFDRLVIETTGIADPETLALPFWASHAVGQAFDLQNTLCLVDAEHIEDWLAETAEAPRQVAFADVILLHKTDLVAPAYLAALEATLRGINPCAALFQGQHGVFPVEQVLAVQASGMPAAHTTEAIPKAHRHRDINTFTLTFDRPFDLNGLGRTLVQLLTVNRHQIYRIKGMIDAEGQPVQVVLQSVRHTFCLTDGDLWDPSKPRQSQIVFIGKGVQREPVERLFERHLLKTENLRNA